MGFSWGLITGGKSSRKTMAVVGCSRKSAFFGVMSWAIRLEDRVTGNVECFFVGAIDGVPNGVLRALRHFD
jgi:hypothetical protein